MTSALQLISFHAVLQGSHPTPTALGLHTHRCAECGNLRPCYSIKCEPRSKPEPWICSTCLAASEQNQEVPNAS
jgi:hypothetical protein